MPEPTSKPDVRLAALLRRFARSVLLGAALIALSLLAGMAGYHYFEALPWLDAFSNAVTMGVGIVAVADKDVWHGWILAAAVTFLKPQGSTAPSQLVR
jgi:hypothetical protein